MNTIGRLKKRLATVREDSLHYKATDVLWGRLLEKGRVHACIYWWLLLPTGLIASAFLLLVFAIILVGGAFCGYIADFKAEEDDPLFFPYKTWKGKKWPKLVSAPYQVVVPAMVVIIGYEVGSRYPHGIWMTVKWGIIIFGALLVIGLIGYILTKGWKQPVIREVREITKTSLSSRFDRVCPVLVIIPENPVSELEPNALAQVSVQRKKSNPNAIGSGRKI